ncbi:MAG: flippase-like domain-containing protein [Chloroflexi bacterium]|nr:flippase-like domain-containing protein [Chloroflexota bacterium]
MSPDSNGLPRSEGRPTNDVRPSRPWLDPFRLLIGLAGLSVAVGLIAVALLLADLRAVAHLISGADKSILAILVLLAVMDQGIRFARWHLLMQRVARERLSIGRGLVGYLAGGTMIFTPARIGEVSKSTYARRLLNVPVGATVPILVAERIADICVMAALASVGLLLVGQLAGNWPPLVAAPVLALGVVAGLFLLKAMRGRGRLRMPGGVWARLPRRTWMRSVFRRWLPSSSQLPSMPAVGESARVLLAPSSLSINAGLGLTAWIVEVAIYALAIKAIDAVATPPLFVAALAVFPLASLIGALSLVPGGLGATEGSLAALGAGLAGIAIEPSLAVGLVARSAILLVVIATGLPAIGIVVALSRRRRGASPATAEPT